MRAGARGRRRPDDEGASLIMGLIIMMLLTTLSLAVLGRTLSSLSFAKAGQDYDAALASADAGLSNALYLIDQTAPPSWHQPGGNAGPNTVGKYEYWASKISDAEYVVSSIGKVGDAKHAIEAKINRSARFPHALFSDQSLRMNGTTSAGGAKIAFYTFNNLLGQPDEVRIGSNTTVICQGPPDPNVYIDWYKTQSDCTSERVTRLATRYDMTVETPPLPHRACPVDGVFGVPLSDPLPPNLTSDPLVTAATPSVFIEGGGGTPYVCRQDVILRGHIQPVNGPVKIYILPTVDASGDVIAHHSLDMTNAVVNQEQSATQFQIFKAGPVAMTFSGNTSSNMTFRGVLMAPETPLQWNGGLWWTGSIYANQLTVNGSPNLKFGYDLDLATYLGNDWKVTRYREIPSSEAGP